MFDNKEVQFKINNLNDKKSFKVSNVDNTPDNKASFINNNEIMARDIIEEY